MTDYKLSEEEDLRTSLKSSKGGQLPVPGLVWRVWWLKADASIYDFKIPFGSTGVKSAK